MKHSPLQLNLLRGVRFWTTAAKNGRGAGTAAQPRAGRTKNVPRTLPVSDARHNVGLHVVHYVAPFLTVRWKVACSQPLLVHTTVLAATAVVWVE